MDNKDILFFSLQDWAKEPQPGSFGDLPCVSTICELPVDSLFVNTAYPDGSSFHVETCLSTAWRAKELKDRNALE